MNVGSHSYDHFTLYLSSWGKTISFGINETTKQPIDVENDHLHPKLKAALRDSLDQKTQLTVLKFLKGIQADHECSNSIHFFHEHNAHVKNHGCPIGFGMHYGRAHECPLDKMIDFVLEQVRILDLKTIEEINTYLDWNVPELETTFWGSRIIKFSNYSLTLDQLIDRIQRIVETKTFIPDHENGPALLTKLREYNASWKDKEEARHSFTRFFQREKSYQDRLDELMPKIFQI